MNGKEAVIILRKGKIIRHKSWRHSYVKVDIMKSETGEEYMSSFQTIHFKENPLIPLHYLCKETDFISIGSINNDITDSWEEYIPFFDYLNIKGYNGFKASIISERDKLIKELQNGYYDIITAKTLFAEYLTDILYHQIKRKPYENVLNFIDKFALSKGADAYNNVIQPLFRSGYCYYFAIMLKDAFNDEGELCLCCPYGHIVWMYKGVPYDIEGVYNGEAELFIPLRFLSTVDIMSFKHVLTDEELGGELDAEYKASVINTFCDSFLKDLGFGGIFEEALEEGIK